MCNKDLHIFFAESSSQCTSIGDYGTARHRLASLRKEFNDFGHTGRKTGDDIKNMTEDFHGKGCDERVGARSSRGDSPTLVMSY